MLSHLIKVKEYLSSNDVQNIYDLEIKAIKDNYNSHNKLIKIIKKNSKDNIIYLKKLIDKLITLSIINTIALIGAIIYTILYNSSLPLFTDIIINIASILSIAYKDFNKIKFSTNFTYFIVLLPFMIPFLPIDLSILYKIVIALGVSQLIILKFNLYSDNYYQKIIKSKNKIDKELKSIFMYNTTFAKDLLRLNKTYYYKIMQIKDSTKILKIINIILPIIIYPSIRFMPMHIIPLFFISSILISMIITKAYSLSLINPKTIIYYCVISVIFSL
ncbi:hypothetical protein [Acidianus manzaensis]|uniref:Uncharacterized protein n=1 Tax=Acidianus manzaensis TaxID=282676 RepID=A0A1W6JZN7_9CREN|nr:hypothetical protein [Acidianus manzaensis]ARM75729.1 hypothetical protein B6F84_06535 [Acidianus manzaensis]